MASPFVDYPTIIRHLETRLLVADLKDILKDSMCLQNDAQFVPRIDEAQYTSALRATNVRSSIESLITSTS